MRFREFKILVVVIFCLTSCSSIPFDYKRLLGKSDGSTDISTGNSTYFTKSAIISAIFKTPSVNRIAEELSVASSQIRLVVAQENTQIISTGAIGVLDEYNTESRGVAYGTLRADRILTDNQRLDNSTKLAQLDKEGKKFDLILEFNSKLQQVLNAYNKKQSAKRTKEIIDKYLKIYDEKASLIERAVAIGAISNSDFLEIRGIRNEALSKLSKATFLEKQSDAKIKQNLGDSYSLAINEIDRREVKTYRKEFDKRRNVTLNKLRVQGEKIEIEILIKKQSLKPTSKLSASITSPQDKNKDKTLFAGMTVEFPVRDGGKSVIEIEILEKQKAILKAKVQETKNKIELTKDNWRNFNIFYSDERQLIKERIKELDILQRQGRVNAGIYIKEVLRLANTEVDLIDLDAEYRANLISRAEASSSVCAVLNLCDELDKYIKNF
jgi:hypothetical protein